MSRLFLLLALPLVLTSCASCGQAGPANRPTPDPENCESACANLKKIPNADGGIGCPEGEDIFTPDQSPDAGPDAGTTVSCTAWCEETQKNGHALDAACVSKITTCEAISTCDW